jgi:hypothetical protein
MSKSKGKKSSARSTKAPGKSTGGQFWRYDGVDFNFKGEKEEEDLSGTVIIRKGEMVLDIPGGYGPYMIIGKLLVGKPLESWYQGKNSASSRSYETEARWAFVGEGTYAGLWVEDNCDYLFSFHLGTPSVKITE